MSRRPFTRALLTVVAPGGTRGLSILVYHRVLPQADPLFPSIVDAERFSLQLELLRRCFNVLPLPEALARLRNGSLPPRAACITFDDGYADNEAVALPLLRQHGLHATFFIASGFLDGGRMWNDTVIEAVRLSTYRSWTATSLDWAGWCSRRLVKSALPWTPWSAPSNTAPCTSEQTSSPALRRIAVRTCPTT